MTMISIRDCIEQLGGNIPQSEKTMELGTFLLQDNTIFGMINRRNIQKHLTHLAHLTLITTKSPKNKGKDT